MPEPDDIELLREYARSGSEDAFGELAARRVNLVYSTALRAVGNPQAAEEITQAVFIILARKAGSLSKHRMLTGWYYRTTCLTASNYIRGEIRRSRREQEAHLQMTANESESSAWTQISPLIDAALHDLGDADRSAILLRYFENKSPGEVAAALQIEEPAARKRVSRALERMRKFFSGRGITLSAAVIATAISANSVHAAPLGLATSATALAAKGVAAGGSTIALADATTKILAWAKIKLAVAAGAAMLLAAGTTVLVVNSGGPATAPPDIAGAWEGIAGLPTDRFTHRAVLKISGSNGAYRATVDIIDQNKQDIPFTTFVYKFPNVRAELNYPGGSAVLDAVLIDGGNHISGIWKQQNQTTPVQLYRTNSPSTIPGPFAVSEYSPRAGSALQGYWKGTLAGMAIALRIAEPTNGVFKAQFDSVEEGIHNIPTGVTYSEQAVNLKVGLDTYSFEGNLESGPQIVGRWHVGTNRTFRVMLQRADPAADLARRNSRSYEFTDTNELPGHWKGTLTTKRAGKNVMLHLALHVARLPDGMLVASLDSPDEFESGIESSEMMFKAPELFIKWVGIGSRLEAKLERGKITGTWHDDAGAHKLSFERSTD